MISLSQFALPVLISTTCLLVSACATSPATDDSERNGGTYSGTSGASGASNGGTGGSGTGGTPEDMPDASGGGSTISALAGLLGCEQAAECEEAMAAMNDGESLPGNATACCVEGECGMDLTDDGTCAPMRDYINDDGSVNREAIMAELVGGETGIEDPNCPEGERLGWPGCCLSSGVCGVLNSGVCVEPIGGGSGATCTAP